MSLLSAPSWRSVPRDAIVWREWDGELVVRNERSGSSHLLGPLAGMVLRVLLEAGGGLRVTDIAAHLSEEPVATVADDWCAAVEEVLAEFRRLGLAEQEPS